MAQSPFAKVVKTRGSLETVFGLFNMRKMGSPWQDVRLRQAANLAINREDLIRYAAKGNGVIIPALIAASGFGYDPALTPYPFTPDQAQSLLREAGYPQGLTVTLIATNDLAVQATVVSKMLEQAGFQVELQSLDATAYNRQTLVSYLEQPSEHQVWDIALTAFGDAQNFPAFNRYHRFALDGPYDWVVEQPALRQLYAQVLHTVEGKRQQGLLRQMERHTRDQAYFLFLYNPLTLYAVNKAVEFVPYTNGVLNLAETGVTDGALVSAQAEDRRARVIRRRETILPGRMPTGVSRALEPAALEGSSDPCLAEQARAADCLQRPLRFRFRQRLTFIRSGAPFNGATDCSCKEPHMDNGMRTIQRASGGGTSWGPKPVKKRAASASHTRLTAQVL